MKFLVIGRAIEYGGPQDPAYAAMLFENVILPSIEMSKQWEEKKKVIGGLFAGQRAGVFITEASSAEELSGMLQQLPFWALNTWEIIPFQSFQSFQSGVENVKMQLLNVKKMVEMMATAKPK